MNPAGGQGAVTAMHDAIVLANWINAVPSNSVSDIEMAFREYKEERFQNAVASFKSCQGAGKILEKVISLSHPRTLFVVAICKLTFSRFSTLASTK